MTSIRQKFQLLASKVAAEVSNMDSSSDDEDDDKKEREHYERKPNINW